MNEWGDRLRDGKRGEQVQEPSPCSPELFTTGHYPVTNRHSAGHMTRTSEGRMPSSVFKATSSGPRFDIGILGHIL